LAKAAVPSKIKMAAAILARDIVERFINVRSD
jgi:hypothetical protein